MKKRRQIPPVKHIADHQSVNPVKVELSKSLRKRMTPEETLLWDQLRGNKCNGLHFRRQQIIDGFVVDFYCHEFGLAIEVDGEIHNEQVDYDTARDNAIRLRGLRVLRFSNEEIAENINRVLFKIGEACKPSN